VLPTERPSLADVCICQVEERQKIKVAKETGSDAANYDPVAAAKDKADFLLTFCGRQAKAEVCDCLDSTRMAVTHF